MTDIEIAKTMLRGHSICLCKDGEWFTDDGRGISPMMRFLDESYDLCGYSVADIIVGKAAAMLFVEADIREVYGDVMSESGYRYLQTHGISASYAKLSDKIINRRGDGICPMEQAVINIADAEEGYLALKSKLEEMRRNK